MAKKILIVDDDSEIRKVIAYALAKWGHSVLAAADGEKGLDLIREKKPDLVLLDIKLPTIDGYEVCRQMKTDEELKRIPVIFCTGGPGSVVSRRIGGWGADDYILKPFDLDELFMKISRFI